MKFTEKAKLIWKNHFALLSTLCFIKFAPALLRSLINNFISVQLSTIETSGVLRGLATASNYIAVFLTVSFFSHFSEWSNLGRSIIITAGVLITAVATFFIGLATKWYHFLILLVCSGIGDAASSSCVYSIILDAFPDTLWEFATSSISPFVFGSVIIKTKTAFVPMLTFSIVMAVVAICGAVSFYFTLRSVKARIRM
ncbi:hypothetical protein MHBO_000108 [Bonamia ostreae]|uniref:Major facilitator superfamily (MFS) profile domain-containing protein n=1 Tax=Bonamia ostreae TaxID=126728 RepID=A0ABV2AEG8_9EUKA